MEEQIHKSFTIEYGVYLKRHTSAVLCDKYSSSYNETNLQCFFYSTSCLTLCSTLSFIHHLPAYAPFVIFNPFLSSVFIFIWYGIHIPSSGRCTPVYTCISIRIYIITLVKEICFNYSQNLFKLQAMLIVFDLCYKNA